VPGDAAAHAVVSEPDLTRQTNAELQGRALPAFQKLVLWLLRDGRDPARLLGTFDSWRPQLEEAGQGRSGCDNLHVLIEYMFRVVDPEYRDELRAKIRTLDHNTEEVAMSIADVIHEEGRVRGRAEGRLAALRSQLLLKFQRLDAAAEARLQAATPEAVDRYLERVLFADSLGAVLAD
jgi:hypothetical protein